MRVLGGSGALSDGPLCGSPAEQAAAAMFVAIRAKTTLCIGRLAHQ